MAWKADKLNREQLIALAKKHVDRYEDLVERGAKGEAGIRINECRAYLETWTDVLYDVELGSSFAKLSVVGQAEIEDACNDGGYDELLESLHTTPATVPDEEDDADDYVYIGGQWHRAGEMKLLTLCGLSIPTPVFQASSTSTDDRCSHCTRFRNG